MVPVQEASIGLIIIPILWMISANNYIIAKLVSLAWKEGFRSYS